jgi:anthranilate synthase component 1
MEKQNTLEKQVNRLDQFVPIVRELPADLETPVSVYLKLSSTNPSFLLESVTGGEQVARYSFIGVNPHKAFVFRGRELETISRGSREKSMLPDGQNPLDFLRVCLTDYQLELPPELPRFAGGLVGYLGYDPVRYFEPSVPGNAHPDLPDAVFLLADTLVAFDHAFGRVLLIANTHLNGDEAKARKRAETRLDDLEARLAGPLPKTEPPRARGSSAAPIGNMTADEFSVAVRRAKAHIHAGDIFQVVLSQRLSRETTASPFEIYRALRRLNPSPYMFYFDFGDLTGSEPFRLIGASPEMHVRLEGRLASVRPIAGTRPRGLSPAEDRDLELELLADPKERAEHVMLVDLARNDLGRVCEYGTVEVREQMTVERYSHVMHIVSHVEGNLQPGEDAFSLMQATFPAGTVSGAPKIRAMQIIQDLEGEPRGPYAGAVGYFSFDGTMDTCITIRTLTMLGQTVSVQAGAGIVADSDPDREYQETLSKARALAEAIDLAESSQSNSLRNTIKKDSQ